MVSHPGLPCVGISGICAGGQAEDSGKSKEEIERDVAVLIPEAKEILSTVEGYVRGVYVWG